MNHYYTNNTDLKTNRKEMQIEFLNRKYTFITDIGVFSKNKLDFGTEVMLEEFIKNNKKNKFSLLDIGCGYGTVSVILSKFFNDSFYTLTDVNDRALELAELNCVNNLVNNYNIFKSSSFENINESFDVIISNPPIRAGKSTIFDIYENSFKYLNFDGEFYCVIQTKHGAKSTEKKLLEIFGNCKTLGIHSGYRVYYCKKEK
ncbi:methyltransferase [Streptobacillus felis]|uniref:Class I SAM-dependent methyltransferase n=1 Tax=Streptobacillus felis TaxID=1384509 RepID=A0A7Z0PFT1_9FUSO|nr:methyltransferase [Streptobacillus felis]NYV27280.1 class I SAM-dependent methyltransferase [Streptobacillus felis]